MGQPSSQLAQLTSLKLVEVENFIAQSKITTANNIKASKIEAIENGINFLTTLASKVV